MSTDHGSLPVAFLVALFPGLVLSAMAPGDLRGLEPGDPVPGVQAPGVPGPRTQGPGAQEQGVGVPAAEIVVLPGQSLAEALAAAPEGARVVLQGGVHRETPYRIDRPVVLEGRDGAVVDAGGEGSVLVVTADHVEIRGLILRNSGLSYIRDHAGLEVEGARHCVFEDLVLEENFFGIHLAKVQDCRVRRNVLRASGTREATSGNGIHAWDSDRMVIQDNDVQGHRDGLYLEFVRGAEIRGNTSNGNLRYGLHFMFSDGSVTAGNSFRDNGAGVALMYSRRIELTDNHFVDNHGPAAYGLLLKDVTDGVVSGNQLRGNTVALFSEGCDRMEIRGNRFQGNGWAVKIMANSQGNRFEGNDFVDNSFDVVTNSRSNPNTFEGNYWSRYRGYDLSGDGFGDVPFRPVRLFGLLVERNPASLILLRSLFADMLDLAERVLPILTPETLVDARPSLRELTRVGRGAEGSGTPDVPSIHPSASESRP